MKFSYSSGAKPLQGFTIKRGIGVGGFGEVYFAISDAGKEVALKKIQRNLDVELRGVRQCLNLNHVNLISLWDIKTNAYGESWVVMEYVPGVSLRDVIEAFPEGMPESEIKKWFAATASGVAYLHKHGIVHRDLKPGNIFRDDDQHIVKIGDYGLSKFIACNTRTGHTESVGTFHYMAPEIGNGVYGKEIDIYALGILLFEMLTGDVPFNGESSQEIIMKHLTANVPLERIPPAFHRVMLKSLNKDSQHRYSSVQSMVKDLPWRDLATNSESITARYAMGHPSLIKASDAEAKINYGPAKIAPIFISGESLEILREEAVFGESTAGDSAISDRPQASPSTENPVIGHNPAIHQSTSPHPGPLSASKTSAHNDKSESNAASNAGAEEKTLADRKSIPVSQQQTSVGRSAAMQSEVSVESDDFGEQFGDRVSTGKAIDSGTHWLIPWWTQRLTATMVKLIVVALVIVLVCLIPSMLRELACFAGLFYLVSYFRRHEIFKPTRWSDGRNSHPPSRSKSEHSLRRGRSKRSHFKTISTFGLTPDQLASARGDLTKRNWRQRLLELIGALLLAALGCIGFNLLPWMIFTPWSDSLTADVLVDCWSRYAFAVVTSVFACWTILITGKFLEVDSDTLFWRRVVMGGLGLMTFFAGWAAADYFDIPLAASPWDAETGGGSGFQIENIPSIAGYALFCFALFSSLRWWHQVDPLRKTRLNLGVIGLCFVWAVIFSHIVGGPVASHGLFGVVVSASIQLAAPWIAATNRCDVISK